MTQELRNRPNNRRGQLTFEVMHDNNKYTVSTGWKQKTGEGPPLEVFLHVDNRRSSSSIEALVRDAAILISFALQHGVSPKTLRDAVTRDDHEKPSTVIGTVLDEVYKQELERAGSA